MAGINGVSQTLTPNLLNNLNTSSASKEDQGQLSFDDVLKDTIQNSEDLNTASNVDSLQLLSGNTDDLAGLMIGSQKSEIALNLTVAIRNKAMDAYKEVMNMQV